MGAAPPAGGIARAVPVAIMSVMERDWLDPDERRPLRRAEYDRLIELGMFNGENIELLHGHLVLREPQGPEHFDITGRIHELLLRALGDRARVFSHSGIAATEDSEPEPDVLVVPPGDYRREKPSTALLLVEVSHSSLKRDRSVKADLYEAVGVPEYWIVDLVHRIVEVRDRPANGTYGRLRTVGPDERIALVTFPDVSFSFEQILPPL